jgi:hypothetical protein
LAWLIMPGPNPHSAAPNPAASRDSTTCRDSSQYQPNAVPASPATRISAKVTPAPSSSVTAASGTPRPSTTVLAIRFTPTG